MNLRNIATIRLESQQIAGTTFKTPKEIVRWMGAMQAQDFYMAKWAVGIRLPTSTDRIVQQAIDSHEILRTHLLRPTWHFVSADDIYWMLELSAPQVKALMKSGNKSLELTNSVFKKSNSIIERALEGNKHLTREELMTILQQAKINTDSIRSAYLMMQAELDKIVCSGITKDKKQTYTLLSERVKKSKTLHKEEALAQLAQRYFTSHCPATVQDFRWWSGLPAADARQALELVKKNFISEIIGTQTYWLTNSFSSSKKEEASLYLLPAYDEFTISYKDRTASLQAEHHARSISINGIFKPTIVINGEVKGLWKRTFKGEKVSIETNFLKSPQKGLKKSIEKAAVSFGNFLEKKTEVIHKVIGR